MRVIVILALILSLLVVSTNTKAEVRTVCASGCQFTSLQGAIDAADRGDIVELQAGEVFGGLVSLVGKERLVIRSSRWRELPRPGFRINPAVHAELLATVRATTFGPALVIGSEENVMTQNGVDADNDTISFEYAPSASTPRNGVAMVCHVRTEGPGTMPAPLVAGQKYWIRDWDNTNRRGRFSETPDSPPIDITTVGSAGSPNYYHRPVCVFWDQPKQIRIQGIRFDVTDGVFTRNLVQVGGNTETDPRNMGPSGIAFHHTVITGTQDSEGPLFCLALFGGHRLVVADSWIDHCKQSDGNESKGIAIQNVNGAVIRNNYVAAASINLLTAGGDSASGDVNRNLLISGNFFEKRGYMMYKEGSGVPTGECYHGGGSGAFYRRTDVLPNTCANGACFTCSADNTWALDTEAHYRSKNYLTKNLLELKDCADCRVEGNMFRGSYGGPDTGQGWCFGISIIASSTVAGGGSGYHRAENVAFRNNWFDACYSGVLITNSLYNATFYQVPLKNVVVENNVLTNLGWFPAMSQFNDPNSVTRFALKQGTGINGFRFANNTIRARQNSYFGLALYQTSHQPPEILAAQYENNLITSGDYPVFLDSSASDCTTAGLFKWFRNDGSKRFRNNVFFGGPTSWFLGNSNCTATVAQNNVFTATDSAVGFTSSTDVRLAATSPFSAANPMAMFKSADTGSDIGADIDMVEQYTKPAERGEPSMPEQLSLRIIAASRSALLRFRSTDDSACTVTLYDKESRVASSEHADTNSAIKKRADRSSSLVAGRQVEFVAGAIDPLTPQSWYHYRVACGSMWAVGRFQTLPDSSGAQLSRRFQSSNAFSVTIEISSASDFATLSSSDVVRFTNGVATASVAMPSGFRYWRWRFLDDSGNTIETGQPHLFVAP